MEPKLSKAFSQYGASMGRQSTAGDRLESHAFELDRITLDSGGYDNGGAYWGTGTPLFRAQSEGAAVYFRAADREAAKTQVLRDYPHATFTNDTDASFDAFVQAYVEAALWSSSDDSDESGGEPLDRNYGVLDIDAGALARMTADCRAFYDANHVMWSEVSSDDQAGHDFWLTRCGHGVGYWDRGYPDAIGKALTDAAEAFGESNLYVGDPENADDPEVRLLYIY